MPAFSLHAAALAADSSLPFPRYAAPSPDGELVAFSCHGDLWTVPANGGVVSQLTAHPGYEKMPMWSPDGRKLAFSTGSSKNSP